MACMLQFVRVVRSASTIVATLPNFQGSSWPPNGLSRFYCNGWWLQATCSLGPSPKEVAGKGKLASAIGVL